MPYTRRQKAAYRRAVARNKAKGRWRTRGTGRGYRVGYNRFGRVSAPELKSKILERDGTMAANTITDLTIFPSITQGVKETERLGNRVNAKFLNVKVILQQKRPDEINLPQEPAVIRYVMWQNKDPTSNAAGTLTGLTLTAFLNTKTIRVLKTGYINLSPSGTARVLKLNHNCRNKTINFKEDTDVSANTSERYYLSLYTSNLVSYDYASKFYWADP